MALLDAGYRVITPDRRGFGKSNQKVDGFDYDTFATDLADLIGYLELDDFALVGFSMGSAEVLRYVKKFGGDRLRAAVLLGALGTHLVQGPENPDGVPHGFCTTHADEVNRLLLDHLQNAADST